MIGNDICRAIESEVWRNLPKILSLRNTGRLKLDNTFVSDGDIYCESLIIRLLSSIAPDALIISEERDNDLSRINDYQTIITVDPIDGTENFVSGLKEWGIGVSVYRNMHHVQSMIMLPELKCHLISGDSIVRISNSRICGLSSYMTTEDLAALNGNYEFRIMGCCMYNMYNVITGSYARFEHRTGCFSWDILPGLNLALEYGLTPMIDGKPYNGEFLMPGIRYRFSIHND